MMAPLAARMRPESFDEFAGQKHLVAPDAAFRKAVEADRLGSVLLWGPPGVGKTTLAEIVAKITLRRFERVSAVSAGVADLRAIVAQAQKARQGQDGLFESANTPQGTVLFIDEIHRFNKSQQDAILPYVEDGTITLIGATTENPSFEVNAALLSRCRVYVLQALEDEDIRGVLRRALASERGLANMSKLQPDAEDLLVNLANGDARASLNMLELVSGITGDINVETVASAVQQRSLLYDKDGEQHFDLISALHKCVRGSDVDASLYWLARMLESGEDPLYLARRIVRMASEDVGLAEPRALEIAMAAQQAVHFLGMPEAALALAEAVAFMAVAPKSNAVYLAYKAAVEDVQTTRNEPVPIHLRNAPTRLMKELGYGEGYKYAHDFEGGIVAQQNRPPSVDGHVYYQPTARGSERRIAERLEEIRKIYQAEN
jgi:putative ATPase